MNRMCYRCSTCGIYWPMSNKYTRCALCDEKCSLMSAADKDVLSIADAEALVAEKEPAANKNFGLSGGLIGGYPLEESKPSSIHGDEVFLHRYGWFMRIGFGPSESEALANTRHDTHAVRRMVEAGCSLDLAVSILL